jgi:hypothetical protein
MRRLRTPLPPSPTATASCRGPRIPVPRAQHGHAAALERQDPRACAPSPRDPAVPAPLLAAPQPSHARATASPCASTPAMRPRRRVRVAAKSLRLFPRAPFGRSHSHTPSAPHVHTHTLIHRTGFGPATPDPVEADKWDRPVSTEEKDEDRRAARRRSRSGEPSPRRREAGLRRIQAEPFTAPSQPAARAGLLSRRPS